MWELIAISAETNRVWRWRMQGPGTVQLGRSPRTGWATPWDRRISAVHATLTFHPDHVVVERAPTARNAIHCRNRPGVAFQLRSGEEFRIGHTTFRLYALRLESLKPPPNPAVPDSAGCSSQPREKATPPMMLPGEVRPRDQNAIGRTRSEDQPAPPRAASEPPRLTLVRQLAAALEQLDRAERDAQLRGPTPPCVTPSQLKDTVGPAQSEVLVTRSVDEFIVIPADNLPTVELPGSSRPAGSDSTEIPRADSMPRAETPLPERFVVGALGINAIRSHMVDGDLSHLAAPRAELPAAAAWVDGSPVSRGRQAALPERASDVNHEIEQLRAQVAHLEAMLQHLLARETFTAERDSEDI